MNKEPLLTEKEFEIINVIANGLQTSQRDLSSQVGLSLGMTNLLLKRLVEKGYLKVQQLNRKKVEYLLSTKGFSEKAKKAYHYTLRTVRNFGLIRENLLSGMSVNLGPSIKKLMVLGEDDLAEFIRLVLKDKYGSQYTIEKIQTLPATLERDVLILNATQRPYSQNDSSFSVVDIIPTLQRNQALPKTVKKEIQNGK